MALGFPYYIISHLEHGRLKDWMHVRSHGVGSRKFGSVSEAEGFFLSSRDRLRDSYEESGIHGSPLDDDQYVIVEHVDQFRTRIVRIYEGVNVVIL